jgi:hypothetical protein
MAETASLAEAAQALESELRRYEELALELVRERLDSEKHLRRAAQALNALRDSDLRLGQHVSALVAAIGEAQSRQQTHASAVQARADEIRRRGETLAALMSRWEALGRDAAQVTQLVQQAAGETSDRARNGADPRPEPRPEFAEVDLRLTRLADAAGELARAAEAEQFVDIGRQIDGLRGQVLGARNRLRLAR